MTNLQPSVTREKCEYPDLSAAACRKLLTVTTVGEICCTDSYSAVVYKEDADLSGNYSLSGCETVMTLDKLPTESVLLLRNNFYFGG